jgi:hypothetical protein
MCFSETTQGRKKIFCEWQKSLPDEKGINVYVERLALKNIKNFWRLFGKKLAGSFGAQKRKLRKAHDLTLLLYFSALFVNIQGLGGEVCEASTRRDCRELLAQPRKSLGKDTNKEFSSNKEQFYVVARSK